jgi:hypothetical protein
MTKRTSTFRVAMLCGAIALTSLTACNNSGTATAGSETAAAAIDPILANPQVGDLYSGELTAFSAANFGQSGSSTATKAYGMMRVVDVDESKVTVITEQGAWPTQAQATTELNSGSMSTITWDEQERIPITRAQFATLVSEGKLAAFRRP